MKLSKIMQVLREEQNLKKTKTKQKVAIETMEENHLAFSLSTKRTASNSQRRRLLEAWRVWHFIQAQAQYRCSTAWRTDGTQVSRQ